LPVKVDNWGNSAANTKVGNTKLEVWNLEFGISLVLARPTERAKGTFKI